MKDRTKCVGDQPRSIKLTLNQIKALGECALKSDDISIRKLGSGMVEYAEREIKKDAQEVKDNIMRMFDR